MKKIQKLTFLFSLVTLIFIGCEKNDLQKKDNNITLPTIEDSQMAKETLPTIEGWNSQEKPNVDFKILKSGAIGDYFQITGQYWDQGAFSVHGNLRVTGCLPQGYTIHVVYWLYNYNTQNWKNVQQLSGLCMDEDNLNMFHAYYSDVASSDCYVIVASQIYIQDPSGNVSLWDTFYSNVVLLDWPF
jgi:hypothetical protein